MPHHSSGQGAGRPTRPRCAWRPVGARGPAATPRSRFLLQQAADAALRLGFPVGANGISRACGPDHGQNTPLAGEIPAVTRSRGSLERLSGRGAASIGHLGNVTPDVIASNAVVSRSSRVFRGEIGPESTTRGAGSFSLRGASSSPGVVLRAQVYECLHPAGIGRLYCPSCEKNRLLGTPSADALLSL